MPPKKRTSLQSNTLLNYFESPTANNANIEKTTTKSTGKSKGITILDISNVSKKKRRLLSESELNEFLPESENVETPKKRSKIEGSQLNFDSKDERTPKKQTKMEGNQSSFGSKDEETPKKQTKMEEKQSSFGSKDEDTPKKQTKMEGKQFSSGSKDEETPIKQTKMEGKQFNVDSKIVETPTKETKMEGKQYNFDKFAFASGSSSKPISEPGITGTTVIEKESEEPRRWAHEKLDFLKPKKIRDINKNRPGDPNYDSHTLFVPNDFLNTLTPAMKQWWDLKKEHYDSVLFFKVGKFYELYHMDAVVGVNYLGFTYMKGDFAHSGFPETAYEKMSQILIQEGFKVARVEQTETPDMMKERCKVTKRPTKYDKVVKREICQISTRGACLLGVQNKNATNEFSSYMISIVEKEDNNNRRFGACFVDTTIGTFHLSEFKDDLVCSRLLSLLAEHSVALILTEKGRLSSYTEDILKKVYSAIKREILIPEKQFYSASTVIKRLNSECYFKNENDDVELPTFLNNIIVDGLPKENHELMLHAFGGVMWYLKDSLNDIQLISMGKFKEYCPVDTLENSKSTEKGHMILDYITLHNLKILGEQGTLQKTVDFCCTAFGKRTLQNWLCRPLCNLENIEKRQNAVKELYDDSELLMSIRNLLRKLPDLERQVAKISIFGNKKCSTFHPDSRAIFYESKEYTKRKIYDFVTTLDALQACTEIPEMFKDCSSKLLLEITQYSEQFKDITSTLQYFKSAFDRDAANKSGNIIPEKGVDKEFDDSEDRVTDVKNKLDEYLEEQSVFFKCEVKYFGNDKKRFQLEVPVTHSKRADNDYSLEGTRKGAKPVNRYTTATSRQLLADMIKAEEYRTSIIKDLTRKIFEKFSGWYDDWNAIIQCLSVLDCICSLAEYAHKYSGDICLPELSTFCDNPFASIKNGMHPCINNVENFIPNDTDFGTEERARVLILTGPNMGGKSTLMRQVVLINIMAQLGSFVPASSCKMSLVDRVFSRLGAQDEILKHRSTFLVEMEEAVAILKHATQHSLVLLDELGRGTSTHDGCSIATAYVKQLCKINCRAIFSTHYHSLVDHYQGEKDIQLGHMTCMVENQADVDNRKVVFLYKLDHGLCPKSYGFDVALVAGLSSFIVARAEAYAREFETKNLKRQLIQAVLKEEINKVVKHAKALSLK